MATDDKASGNPAPAEPGRDFIRDIVQADLDAGRVIESDLKSRKHGHGR